MSPALVVDLSVWEMLPYLCHGSYDVSADSVSDLTARYKLIHVT